MKLVTRLKRLNNQKGLSILEVLTAIFIFSMVVSIAYSMLFMALSIYKSVLIEGEMRSKGEALFSELIMELKDAIYVENVPADPGLGERLSIAYIKRSADPEVYLEQYRMTMIPDQGDGRSVIEVMDMQSGDLTRTFDLGHRFRIREGRLEAVGNQDAVHLLVLYGHRNVTEKEEQKEMKIDSRIPLLRAN